MHSPETDDKRETLRVVVADDDCVVRQAIERLLRGSVDVIRSVSNGHELVEAAQACRPDVVVSDVMMPELSGFEAMKTLRDRGGLFPFVLVSADTSDVLQWTQLGASVVHKMDMAADLVKAVRAAADGEIYISQQAIRK